MVCQREISAAEIDGALHENVSAIGQGILFVLLCGSLTYFQETRAWHVMLNKYLLGE